MEIVKIYSVDDIPKITTSLSATIGEFDGIHLAHQTLFNKVKIYYPLLNIETGEIYEEYTKRLETMQCLDFDDLLLWTVRMFKLHDTVLAKWQYRFPHL